ncbi:uncharacterized protein LOC126976172 [Leptidea sinapis]|uniref:uncharacterized protein LOC126976172 n=1 Tax=Leptidea sinapis TaxID=189913 RepID=UPI00214618ED|nr:uncharacterized protein LOC126976172 [Leptidea sinapis]
MTESNPLNMSQPPEEELSDDEIFFGKITLKEVKKAIYLDRYKYILENRKKNKNKNMDDDSFRLIEVQSEPERFSTESSNSSVGAAISALAATASNSSIASANSELATTSSNSIAAPANSKLVATLLNTSVAPANSELAAISPNSSVAPADSELVATSLNSVAHANSELPAISSKSSVAPADSELVATSLNSSVSATDSELVATSLNSSVAPADSEHVATSLNSSVSPTDSEFAAKLSTPSVGTDNSEITAMSSNCFGNNQVLSTNSFISVEMSNLNNISEYTEKSTNKISDVFANITSNDGDITANDDTFLQLEKMCSEIDTTKPVEEQLKIHEKRHQLSLSVDDSFIQLEKMISNMNTESNETGILYDTTATLKKAESCEELMKDLELNDPQIQSMDENRLKYYNLQEKTKHDNSHTTSTSKVKSYMTPIRNTKEVNLRVPLTEKNHLFKTPLSIKAKSPCRMKTQSKINKFDHISSPIASYIKERPHTPLPRNDSTKKPKSSIPKFVKQLIKTSDKENGPILHQSKSAKKTIMICTPNKEKIPQSMEKKSQVMSHQHKILHPTKKLC